METAAWVTLTREMAVEAFAMEAAEMYLPLENGRNEARRRMLLSEQPNNDFAPGIQEWRNLEHMMGAAILALEKLGYKIVAP